MLVKGANNHFRIGAIAYLLHLPRLLSGQVRRVKGVDQDLHTARHTFHESNWDELVERPVDGRRSRATCVVIDKGVGVVKEVAGGPLLANMLLLPP